MAEDNKQNEAQLHSHRHHHHRHHHRKFWRGFWIVIGILVVIGLFVCGMIYKNLRDTTNNMYEPVAKTKSNKGRTLDNLLSKKKPIDILLLGTDTGAMGRHYKGRTDAMMLMAINPKIDKTTIISIPRDSNAIFPDYPQYGVTKMNSAYTLGGVDETIKTIDKYYSVPVDGYLLVNFGGLVKAINQVGGIDVVPPLSFNNMGYTFTQGQKTHMDGKKTLAFVDMRHQDPKADYGRQERQRLVIQALLKKSVSPATLLNDKFLNSMSSEMQTNLTMKQMYEIAMNYRSANNNSDSDHAQGVSKMTNNPKFGQMEIEVVSRAERQRVSNKLRNALGMPNVTVAANKASYIMNH